MSVLRYLINFNSGPDGGIFRYWIYFNSGLDCGDFSCSLHCLNGGRVLIILKSVLAYKGPVSRDFLDLFISWTEPT